MVSRIALLLITLFWVVMNFLLWRSEFGGRNHLGTSVPVEVVWQKILTAPDNSQLEIMHHGKRVGYCRLSASVGQELATGKIVTDDLPPEALPQKPTGFRIDFDGHLAVIEGPNRLGFNITILFNTNQVWQDFNARLNLRPDAWEIHARAGDQTLQFRSDSEGEKTDRLYKFSDLQNPQFLAQEFQLPVSLQIFSALGLPSAGKTAAPLSLGLVWVARNDWITIGHASVRTYRLEGRLFDRFRVIVMVSRVGEIMRVELPDEWVLFSDPLSNL